MRTGPERLGEGGRAIDLHPGAGHDSEPGVRVVAVQKMSPVPPAVHEVRHGASGIGLEGKAVQCLIPVRQRRDEQRHDGSVDCMVVAVFQFVLDRMKRGHDGSPSSTG